MSLFALSTIEPLLTPEEAAALLGVSVRGLGDECSMGLPFHRLSARSLRFVRKEVLAWKTRPADVQVNPVAEPVKSPRRPSWKRQQTLARESLERLARLAELPTHPGVYFIAQRAHATLVKIGVTSGSIRDRARVLQSGSPVALVLLGWLPGGRNVEAALHDYWHDFREHGEWFRFEGALREYIENIACAVAFDGGSGAVAPIPPLKAKRARCLVRCWCHEAKKLRGGG